MGTTNLYVDDCDFTENRIAVYSEFLTAGALIENSTFESCETRIHVDRCENLKLEGNTFFNSSEQGIYSIDSYMTIPTSTFTNNNRGLTIESRFPVYTGLMLGGGEGNLVTFQNNDIGIVSSGATHPMGLNISNCIFDNNETAGAIFRGENEVSFKNNKIQNADLGVMVDATGNNFNELNCNEYENISLVGNMFENQNIRTQFLENHFIGQHFINYGLLDAQVFINQGIPANPAANCFSEHLGGPPIREIASVNSVNFNYHYFDDSVDADCEDPEWPGNYTKIRTLNIGNNCDGKIGIFGLIDPDGDGVKGFNDPKNIDLNVCLSCIINKINAQIINVIDKGGDDIRSATIESVAASIQNSTSLSVELNASEEILDQWINYGLYIGLATQNYALKNRCLRH